MESFIVLLQFVTIDNQRAISGLIIAELSLSGPSVMADAMDCAPNSAAVIRRCDSHSYAILIS